MLTGEKQVFRNLMKAAQKTELYKQDGIAPGVIPDKSCLFKSAASDQAEDFIALVPSYLMKDTFVGLWRVPIECEMIIVEYIPLLVNDPRSGITEYHA